MPQDPWEDAKKGKALFSGYPCVYEFVGLPGIGHCPQDEAPEVVNPLIERFIVHVKSLSKAEPLRCSQ
jgi:pimeloyl-ACP methyl ester carboxylesterase